MKELAKDFYKQGYSCSESVLKAAAQKGYIPEDFIKLATAFSGGMSSGCLCGAVAGAQLVISFNYGRIEQTQDSSECRMQAKELVEKFKNKNKFTCCKALSAKYEFGSQERKENCTMLVEDAAEILDELMKVKICK